MMNFDSDCGYSQEAFALECGISRAYYGRCELGLHSFTVDKLQLICNLLNLNLYDLFLTKDKKQI
jgi:transcriptional regulator with XRE-family HTH domain